ncbi:hypothetical protein NCCP2222_33730 [Sporosarcina sp. NCCP-2222]|uniref:SWIM zinc finger family protein n=1 Tax=Sporosarcina sp. NCCP-2222 TaxID=2935073 RepID=UPI002083F179|nr:SWIM zinc finger family protein [Sporosarcina sp. NCCP-2222]GKV57426.1 hypothetical protein NCCP2222_33730 [Sporosarcina sp. NCCP-2222]
MHLTAERVSYLHEQDIEELLNVIKETCRPSVEKEAAIVQRAVHLVRQGAVQQYTYSDDEVVVTLSAVVPFTVRLAFGRSSSNCTCPSKGICEHVVAVAFHLYMQFNSLSEWLQEWRQSEVQQLALKISERTPEAWISVLGRLMDPIRALSPSESASVFLHETDQAGQRMLPLSPFEYEWKPLFELYYQLLLIDAAMPYLQKNMDLITGDAQHYPEWQLLAWIRSQFEKIQKVVKSLGSRPKLFETDPFYEKAKGLLRGMVLGHQGLFRERILTYILLWDKLFTENAAREKERLHLQQETASEKVFLEFALDLIQNNQAQLEEIALREGGERIDCWLPIADYCLSIEMMDALNTVMNTIYPHIAKYYKSEVPFRNRLNFIRKIDGLLEEADFSGEERERMFMNYGMASVPVYADFLIERERFAEWSALMHRFDVSFDSIDSDTFRLVSQRDPMAVMPLFHTYAMRFIGEKNRHSYRRAVRIFKRMRTCAKKSGQIDFWNRYIDTVRDQYRRLRALNEEMEKGNLNL